MMGVMVSIFGLGNIFDMFFSKYSNNSKKISLKILKSLDKNERKNIQLKFDELARSCSTCHRKFRN